MTSSAQANSAKEINSKSAACATKIDFGVDPTKVFGLKGDNVTTTAGRTR